MAIPLGCWHVHKAVGPSPLIELSTLETVSSRSPIPDISELFSRQALQVFFGTAGNITGLLCLFAPLPTFARIIRKKSTEKFSSVPYVTAMLSAAIWTLYASPMLSNSFQMLTISLLSVVVQAIYVGIFIFFAREAALRGAFLNLAGAATVFMMIFALGEYYEPASDRAAVVGLCGDVLGVASFAAPLSVLGLVIRTKSSEFLPITLVLYMAMNGVMWTSYAITIQDIFVFVPNGLGVLLSLGQVILYFMYRNPPSSDIKKPSALQTEGPAPSDSVWPKLHVKIAKPYLDGVSGISASPRLIAPLLIRQLSHTINMIRDSAPSTPTVEIASSEYHVDAANGVSAAENNGGNSPAIVYRDGSAYVVKALDYSRRPRHRMRVSSMQPRTDDEEDLQQLLLTDLTPDWRQDLVDGNERVNGENGDDAPDTKEQSASSTRAPQLVIGT